MAGLLLLAVFIGYIVVWTFLFKFARNRLGKIGAVCLGLLIPFWDIPIGLPIFALNCSKEAGTRIEAGYRLPSQSILVDKTAGFTPREMLRFGFNVIEYESGGQIVRYTADSTGLTKSSHPTPASSIRVELSKQTLPLNMTRDDYLVKDIRRGNVVGRQTDFYWRTPWWTAQADASIKNQIGCDGGRTESLLATLGRMK